MNMSNQPPGAADATDAALAHRIENALIVKGKNVRQLASEAGLSYYTLRKSLKGERPLTLGEFGRIAHALNVHPLDMLPESITARSAA